MSEKKLEIHQIGKYNMSYDIYFYKISKADFDEVDIELDCEEILEPYGMVDLISTDAYDETFRGFKSLEVCLNISYSHNIDILNIIYKVLNSVLKREGLYVYDPQLDILTRTIDYDEMRRKILNVKSKYLKTI